MNEIATESRPDYVGHKADLQPAPGFILRIDLSSTVFTYKGRKVSGEMLAQLLGLEESDPHTATQS
jgi:hypothetical protein